jgi:hypothetical protein
VSEVLTVVGEYDKIEEKKSGWFDVHIKVPGKKYPVRLSTKSSNLLDEVRATQGALSTFTYKESESSSINERTQKPYTNRYLESVTAGATAEAQAAAAGNSERMTKEEWNAKDRRDFRSRAWAQTISAFVHTIKSPTGDFNDIDPLLVFAKLKPFQRKLYEDIVGDLEPKQQATPQPAAPAPAPAPPAEDPGRDEPPPYDDDDIPF